MAVVKSPSIGHRSIMDSIPTDIFRYLFNSIHQEYRLSCDPLSATQRAPEAETFTIQVSQVCRSWRSLSLSIPSLWSTLAFTAYPHDPSFKRQALWLRRTAPDTPLDISLRPSFRDDRYPDSPSVYLVIGGEIHRWRSFVADFSTHYDMEQLFSPSARLPMAILKNIYMTTDRRYTQWNNGSCLNAPVLEELKLYKLPINENSFGFCRQIRVLVFNECNLPQDLDQAISKLLQLLRHLSLLEDLQIDPSGEVLQRFHGTSAVAFASRIEHHCLRSLKIGPTLIDQLLPSIVVPHLKSLRSIYVGSYPVLNTFDPFPTVAHLRLKGGRAQDNVEYLPGLFSLFPFLTSLSLSKLNFPTPASFWVLIREPPNLEELDLDYCRGPGLTGDILCQVVVYRQTMHPFVKRLTTLRAVGPAYSELARNEEVWKKTMKQLVDEAEIRFSW